SPLVVHGVSYGAGTVLLSGDFTNGIVRFMHEPNGDPWQYFNGIDTGPNDPHAGTLTYHSDIFSIPQGQNQQFFVVSAPPSVWRRSDPPFPLAPGDTLDMHSMLSSAGFVAGGVPEPATWLMLIFGFVLPGTALRRRRAMVAI